MGEMADLKQCQQVDPDLASSLSKSHVKGLSTAINSPDLISRSATQNRPRPDGKWRCNLYSYILLALFGTNNRTPPTVLALGPWNFQRSLPMVWGWSAREDFLIPPPQPAPGSKRCRQIRSGGPSAYFRASFAKYKLLGIVWGVI